MQFTTDLHLHSKYSRAVSPNMVLSEMEKFALKKGIDVLTASDFTHPLWFRELKAQLVEDGEGIYSLKSNIKNQKSKIKFILSTEISSIYSQGGKTRRVHNLIFAPSLATVEKINTELIKRGCNLNADGRPIIGLSSRNLLDLVLSIDPKAFLIPAHCLKPDTLIHTKEGMKKIKNVAIGDFVYTHKNRTRRITQVFRRPYLGDLYHVRPWYFSLGLATTPEHPFYAFRVKTCSAKGGRCLPTASHKKICKKRFYDMYKPEWIRASRLSIGDVLVFPRFQNTTPLKRISLATDENFILKDGNLYTGGTRGRVFSETVGIDKAFCRLIGYYLAEGYTNGRDEIAFTFHENEKDYVADVIYLMSHVFGISHHRIYKRTGLKSVEISFYSKLLVPFFTNHFYTNPPYRATTKKVPDWMLHLPTVMQAELLRGWWRGDSGYTSSRQLMNGMKIVCLRLGIVPSIFSDLKENHKKRGKHRYQGRTITASENSYVFSHLAFFEDSYNLLSDATFKDAIRKLTRRHGWIDQNYIYLPIRRIEKIPYNGEVFNLEVEEDNSYVAEFAAVHNCWTPWFSLYGSFSGFDSIEECFQDLSKEIYGVETGLSSDPEMNWRIKELDNRSILSFSDAHSAIKMGREATVFVTKDGISNNPISNKQITFDSIKSAIKRDPKSNLEIGYTIEFYPEEGKYHYTGHRNCKVTQTPEETKEKGIICPVCKRGLTVGVMQRVQDLAREFKIQNSKFKLDEYGVKWIEDPRGIHPPFVRLVPLIEIIAESVGVMPGSLKVINKFDEMVSAFGSELKVLIKTPISDIEKSFGEKVAQGIDKVRRQDIYVNPGFDGEYGKVKIWDESIAVQSEKVKAEEQMGLF